MCMTLWEDLFTSGVSYPRGFYRAGTWRNLGVCKGQQRIGIWSTSSQSSALSWSLSSSLSWSSSSSSWPSSSAWCHQHVDYWCHLYLTCQVHLYALYKDYISSFPLQRFHQLIALLIWHFYLYLSVCVPWQISKVTVKRFLDIWINAHLFTYWPKT